MATRDDVTLLDDPFWPEFLSAHGSRPFYKNWVTDRLIVWEPTMMDVQALGGGSAPTPQAAAWVG